MSFELDTDDVDLDNLHGSGFDKPVAGKCHMMIQDIDTHEGTDDAMTVDYEVIAHEKPDQEGKTIRDYYYKKGQKADSQKELIRRMICFAVATGLTSEEELRRLKAEGKKPKINFEAAVGRHVCLEVREETYQGKKKSKCGFDVFGLNDPKAEKFPKLFAAVGNASVSSQAAVDEYAGAGF